MNNRQSKKTRKYGEILTPEWMVTDMLDATEPSVSSPSVPILDMCAGTGNFIVEIVQRRCMNTNNSIEAISHAYACEIQSNNVTVIRDRIKSVLMTAFPNECEDDNLLKQIADILEKNVTCADALEYIPPEQISAIVSNPPYQRNIAGSGTRNRSKSLPIYQHFWYKAVSYNPSIMTFIMPAKWYTGGWNLDDLRKGMLSDRHIIRLSDYRVSGDVFPNAEVNGGVCWIVRDSTKTASEPLVSRHTAGGELAYEGHRKLTIDGCNSLIRDETSMTIVNKAHDYIIGHDNQSFDRMMLGTTPFGLPADTKTFDNVTEEDSNHTIDVLCIKNKHVFVTQKNIKKNVPSIGKWNVAVQLCHNQHDPNPISAPVLLPPNGICTHSWVCTKPVDSKEEAKSIASYMRTRTFRFLVGIKKMSPIGTRKVYSLVPIVPFDREWDDSATETELGLTPDEITYIHETTPEMR